jgi:hypothetical protein
MPTQEERLTALEQNFLQFKADAVKSYQDMAMQVTLFRGLTETIIGRLATMQYQIDQRFNTLEAKFDTVQTTLEAKFDTVQTTLTEILARLPEKP